MKAFAKAFPEKVPGIYEIGLVVAGLDQHLSNTLFSSQTQDGKALEALNQAQEIKKLIQKARQAVRRTANSRDEDIAEIRPWFGIRRQVHDRSHIARASTVSTTQ